MLLRFQYVKKLINGNTCKSKHCFVNICEILLLFCGNCHGSTVTLRVPPAPRLIASLHCAVSRFLMAPLFSFTLFSHCGLCLCLHISISLSACVHVLHFFLFFGLLSLFCDTRLFSFLHAGLPFICRLFLQSAPACFILFHIPCCLPPISLFSSLLCSV